jgi:DNA-binding HxlR family transcriptional regulator
MKELPKAKQLIIDVLAKSDKPLAVHELPISGYSQNNLATRLSELAKDGLVFGQVRPGTHYKEWGLFAGF